MINLNHNLNYIRRGAYLSIGFLAGLHKKKLRADFREIFREGYTMPNLDVIGFWLWSGSASGSRIGLKDSLPLPDRANFRRILCFATWRTQRGKWHGVCGGLRSPSAVLFITASTRSSFACWQLRIAQNDVSKIAGFGNVQKLAKLWCNLYPDPEFITRLFVDLYQVKWL